MGEAKRRKMAGNMPTKEPNPRKEPPKKVGLVGGPGIRMAMLLAIAGITANINEKERKTHERVCD